jgi:hypothetical protein
MKVDFLTPVGRLVQGDPMEAQTKNMAGQPLVTKSGQPTQRFFCGVAFRKDDPNFAAFYAKIADVARASFPHLFNAQGQCTHPRFSFKVMDGDGVDDNGKRNAEKPGFAGCYVVKFQSSFAPRCFYAGKYQPHEQIQDPRAIQRGYYVRISGTIEGNDDANKPGVYVNLGMVELVGGTPADIIASGPDASAVFGGAAPQLPAGVAPIAMGAPALPGMPVAAAAAPGVPALPLPGAPVAGLPSTLPPSAAPAFAGPAMTSPSSPALPVAPNPGILAGPQMTAKAGQFTYAQFIASGWNDARLREEGYML